MPAKAHSDTSPRTRRRSPAYDPLKKTSVQMHTSTIEAVRRAVSSGAAASQNEFVEAAVIARLRDLRRAKVYASYRDAAADPEYVQEMESTTGTFDPALGDGLVGPDR